MIKNGGREVFPKSVYQPAVQRVLLSSSRNVRNVSRGLPFLTHQLSQRRVLQYPNCSERY